MLAALAVLAACGGSERVVERADDDTGSPPASLDEGTPSPTAAARSARGGTLAVTVVDTDGRPRSDVPVVVGGTRRLTRRGVARFAVPAGDHRLVLPVGCHDRVEVLGREQRRTVGVPAGRTVRVRLGADVRRRYAAGSPVVWDSEPPWPVGETVAFRFSLYDRCASRLAARVAFPYLVYAASAGIRVVDEGTKRSDAQAFVAIRLRCARGGNPTVRLQDPDNPADGVDLLGLRPPFNPDDPWCE